MVGKSVWTCVIISPTQEAGTKERRYRRYPRKTKGSHTFGIAWVSCERERERRRVAQARDEPALIPPPPPPHSWTSTLECTRCAYHCGTLDSCPGTLSLARRQRVREREREGLCQRTWRAMIHPRWSIERQRARTGSPSIPSRCARPPSRSTRRRIPRDVIYASKVRPNISLYLPCLLPSSSALLRVIVECIILLSGRAGLFVCFGRFGLFIRRVWRMMI